VYIEQFLLRCKSSNPVDENIDDIYEKFLKIKPMLCMLQQENDQFIKRLNVVEQQLQEQFNITKELKQDISTLKEDHNLVEKKLNEDISTLKQEINDFKEVKEKIRKQEILLCLYDLMIVFRTYFIIPNLPFVGFSTWNEYVNNFFIINDKVTDMVVDVSKLNDFKKELNDKLPNNIDVADLIRISKYRHAVAHIDLRSATDQNNFVSACTEFNFGEYQELADKLLDSVKTVKFRRIT
jgi:hypothetical protein